MYMSKMLHAFVFTSDLNEVCHCVRSRGHLYVTTATTWLLDDVLLQRSVVLLDVVKPGKMEPLHQDSRVKG